MQEIVGMILMSLVIIAMILSGICLQLTWIGKILREIHPAEPRKDKP